MTLKTLTFNFKIYDGRCTFANCTFYLSRVRQQN